MPTTTTTTTTRTIHIDPNGWPSLGIPDPRDLNSWVGTPRDASVRVLVCGDRNWRDRHSVQQILQTIHANALDLTIIHGRARGADTMAAEQARLNGILIDKPPGSDSLLDPDYLGGYPALWKTYGRAAGPIRNMQMLREGHPDLVVAFHNSIERSKGTANMLAQAARAGVPCLLFSHTEQEGDRLRVWSGELGILRRLPRLNTLVTQSQTQQRLFA